MSEKRYTQDEIDAIILEVKNGVSNLEGLTDEQVAERKASIERKYGLSAGVLSDLKLSTGEEAEKQKIYKPHYEATMEELDAMTMDEYKKWSDLGSHLKQPPPDIEAEERARAQAEENELMDNMSMEEYVAYRNEKESKAEQEKEAAARLIQEEQKRKVEDLRHKNPEEMSMEEYATYVARRDAKK